MYREKEDPTENLHERGQIWDFIDRDFKAVIINICKLLKEIMNK